MTDLERLARRMMEAESWSSFWGLVEATALCRAILKELREPSDNMMVEAYANPVKDPLDFWQAMINSILEEDPS